MHSEQRPVSASSTDDRQAYRTLLLFLLLLTVAVWAWLEHRKPLPPDRTGTGPQPRTELVDHNGAKVREVWNLPYTYHPGVPLEEMAMDLFIPEGARDCPVLIYCHGGGWAAGNKNGIGPKSLYFASSGILVASVNYRLGEVRPRRSGATDIADAIRFLHHEVGPLGGDPNRIFIMGHSAGAHLAALAICDPNLLARDAQANAAVRGLILLDSAAYDTPAMLGSGTVSSFENVFGHSTDNWIAVSPYQLALKRTALPPMMLACSTVDPDPRNLATRATSAQHLADAVRKSGSSATIIQVPGRDHYNIDTSMGQPDDPLMPLILKFIQDNGKLD